MRALHRGISARATKLASAGLSHEAASHALLSERAIGLLLAADALEVWRIAATPEVAKALIGCEAKFREFAADLDSDACTETLEP